jgi:hypothetical protein
MPPQHIIDMPYLRLGLVVGAESNCLAVNAHSRACVVPPAAPFPFPGCGAARLLRALNWRNSGLLDGGFGPAAIEYSIIVFQTSLCSAVAVDGLPTRGQYYLRRQSCRSLLKVHN